MKIIKAGWISGRAEPVIETLPDSAMQKSGKPFFIPDFAKEFRFKLAVGVRVSRLGKNIAARFARRYYDSACLCLAFEASDLLTELRGAGTPWSLATAFDGAIIVGADIPQGIEALGKAEVALSVDGVAAQTLTAPSPERFDELIAAASRHFTLKIGDMALIESPTLHDARLNTRVTAAAENFESINIKIK